MFRVDRVENRIHRLEEKRFSDLGLRERENLQEWLAATPDALGEELLIIQKEFDGFADTRERLDLLALDKNGQLVIIENKLDDTGRDVVWQAIKYAAYCSNLTKTQIVEIFQQYLDRVSPDRNAENTICEFLDEDSLDEIVLNGGNDQRLMFIAANFRKEVTAAVLWLLGHGLRAQCFRVVPHGFGEELFIDLQQIIPTPEAADYMIGMATKGAEEKSAGDAQQRSHKLRLAFWEQALEVLRLRGLSQYDKIGPSKDHWLNCGAGVSGCSYALVFLRDQARVELVLQRAEATENKWLFDKLLIQRDGLSGQLGDKLEWRRMDDKKSSKIQLVHQCDGYNPATWPEIINWMERNVRRLEKAFSEPLAKLNQEIKTRTPAT